MHFDEIVLNIFRNLDIARTVEPSDRFSASFKSNVDDLRFELDSRSFYNKSSYFMYLPIEP